MWFYVQRDRVHDDPRDVTENEREENRKADRGASKLETI